MPDLKLDPALPNDLVYENGDLQVVTDDEETRQRVEFTLRTQFGEWAFDTALGVPYFEEILVKQFDVDAIKARLTAIIGAVPGVTAVLSLDLVVNNSNRLLTVTGRVDTRGGEAEFALPVAT